jgi:type I restriction enzyme R subunit
MMTTGYDCQDLLNVCLMRPIFSPTDFVQVKGRGTRLYDFAEDLKDKERRAEIGLVKKDKFKLFDFFANCEYFEEQFNYDEVLELPVKPSIGEREQTETTDIVVIDAYENFNPDPLRTLEETAIGAEGMKIDRKLFERFEDRVKSDEEIRRMVDQRDFGAIEDYIVGNVFDKPEDYYTLEKLRRTLKIDRRLSLREIVEKIFGFVPYLKSKNEVLEDEFDKFDSRYTPEERNFTAAKHFFKSYLTDAEFRDIVESRQYARLATNPNRDAFQQIALELRNQITEYIKDNVPLNQFME